MTGSSPGRDRHSQRDYELAANRCVATPDQLREAVQTLGMTLDSAAEAANVGVLGDLLSMVPSAIAAFDLHQKARRQQE